MSAITTSKSKSKSMPKPRSRKAKAAITPVGGADALPKTSAPSVPANHADAPTRRRPRVMKSQVDAASAAAVELRGSSRYDDIFGPPFPDAETIANGLEFGAAWSVEVRRAEAWVKYTKQQEALAWQPTVGHIEAVRSAFASAAKRDPAIGEQLRSFATVLLARSAVTKRSAATRKRTKAASTNAAASANAPETPPTPGAMASDSPPSPAPIVKPPADGVAVLPVPVKVA